jgi:hypothetical protein
MLVYLMKAKIEVFNYFKHFHILITTQFSTHLKIILSGNDTEYMSKDMSYYLCSKHQTSCVDTPQ